MSAITDFDVGPLTWVKGEIDLALNQARDKLAQFAKNFTDTSHLRFCLTHLHQVTGAVQMVGLEGVARFCQETENLVSALEKQEVAASADVLKVVNQAIDALSKYLDDLIAGEPEQALRLFPEYSDLLRMRNVEKALESDLFFPDLSARAPKIADVPQLNEAELSALVKKARVKFQRGLLSWLKRDNTTQGLQLMREAVGSIEQAQAQPVNRTFWWVASALVDSLATQGVEPDFSVKQQCARIDLQMRRLAEGSQKVAERLLRDVLYSVARSEKVSDHIKEVVKVFELDDYLPVAAGEKNVVGTNLQPQLRELKDLLSHAKESWLKFTSGNKNNLKAFQEHIGKLSSKAQGLENQALRHLAAQLEIAANDVANLPEQRFESVGLEMATALLLLENALERYDGLGDEFDRQVDVQEKRLQAALHGNVDLSNIPDIPLLDEMSRRAQEKLLLVQVVHEIKVNLAHAEQVLDAFFRDPSKRSEIPTIESDINQVMGALRMLELERAADLLKGCQSLIRDFANPEHETSQQEQELVAEGLSSLGFYIDAVQHGRDSTFEIISPVLKRFPGYKGRTVEIAAEAPALAPEMSIEAGLDEQFREAKNLLNEWQQESGSETAKEDLRETLTALRQDADLVADDGLKERTSAAIDLLDQGGADPGASLAESIASLVAPKLQSAPSEQAVRLAAATDEAVDAEMLEIYLEEAGEVLERIKENMEICREATHDNEALTTIRRGFHTLKGSGRMVGLTALGEVAWEIEQTLNKWLGDEREATPPLLDMLGLAHDSFAHWVEQLKATGAADARADALVALAVQLRTGAAVVEPQHDIVINDAGVEAIEPEPELLLETSPEEEQAPADEVEVVPEFKADLIEPMVLEPTSSEETAVADAFEAAFAAEAPEEITIAVETAEAVPTETDELLQEEAAWSVDQQAEPFEETELLSAPETKVETVVETELNVGDVIITPTLYQIFLDEAAIHIDTLRNQFATLSQNPAEPIQHDFMRAAHTLCGIASTTGFNNLAELGYALEQWLFDTLEHPLVFTDKQLATTGEAIEWLGQMVEEIRARTEPQPANQLVKSLQELLNRTRTTREKIELDAARELEAQNALAQSTASAEKLVEATGTPEREVQPEALVPAVEREGQKIEEHRVIHDDLDEQLLPIFLEEAQELFPLVGEQLREWRADPSNQTVQQSLQRALHTMKGSARMAGAMRLGELTHNMEERVIDALNEPEIPAGIFDQLETEFDRLANSLDRLQRGDTTPETAVIAPEVGATVAAELPVAQQRLALPADTEQATKSQLLRVRADTVDRLVNEAGEVSIARSRVEGEMLSFKQSLLELTENVIRLRHQLREIEIQAESQMQSRMSLLQEIHSTFDPLEFDRFTHFQELTRMMAESVNDVATVQQTMLKNLDEAESALLAQGRLNRELQQELMHIRMVPFSSLSDRLYRIVRQAAKETGKKANLDIRGAQVELDRGVLDKMTAPFEHLLRNAIAHGLENKDQRITSGKPEFGQIQIDARQLGNEVVLTFSDDGAGLNLDAIRARAVANGLLEEGAEIAPEQLMEMIFLPGFSTAKEVTQLSGRGIGMDVVRNAIAGLGGRVEVASEGGRGTTFVVHLPLTLAVTQTVLVNAGGQTYALPSVMIEQVQELKPEALAKVYETTEVEWMGNHYPFSYLPRLFGDAEHVPPVQRYNSVVLLRSSGQRAAVHVDELVGNREVVVKNIGPQLARVPGIAGATVLGDGRVVMIVNPVQLTHRDMGALVITKAGKLPMPEEKKAVAPLIMVVDDSLTVRKITSRLLAREGYEVVVAKDGVDALQLLQEHTPDVMLVDIEMPRMDGFELTKNVRGDAATKHIPIIMITSRTAEKHRSYAKELGVNAYLGKPYQEEELLGHIAGFISAAVATKH
jgi:chemosensory pili system protein ChpA (sensor histidine kinase/response regulator)